MSADSSTTHLKIMATASFHPRAVQTFITCGRNNAELMRMFVRNTDFASETIQRYAFFNIFLYGTVVE